MNVFIRVDASVSIGSGHVMRCLTLAHELINAGENVFFMSRITKGHLNELIKAQGFQVFEFAESEGSFNLCKGDVYHEWLGVPWEEDAKNTIDVLNQFDVDWLIVDHYGIDYKWHSIIRPYVKKILVVDDLANRKLDCDILLDQTLARQGASYHGLVNHGCKLLLGAKYAMLRSTFLKLRMHALEKRKRVSSINRIFISMGANDPDNITGNILDGLESISWHKEPVIDIVLGRHAPHLSFVINKAQRHSLPVEVTVDADDMAKRMLDADLAIGAAGATSWERCCLGLPTVMMVVADNQETIAENIVAYGLAFKTLDVPSVIKKIEQIVDCDMDDLRDMSHRCFNAIDGKGVERVCSSMRLGY